MAGKVIDVDVVTTLEKFELEKTIQTGIVEVPLPQTLPDDLTAAGEIGLPFSIGFLSVFVVAVGTYLWASKLEEMEKQRSPLPSRPQALPCLSCSFYTQNPYLKCAVRPTTAMTREATSCSDYEMNQ